MTLSRRRIRVLSYTVRTEDRYRFFFYCCNTYDVLRSIFLLSYEHINVFASLQMRSIRNNTPFEPIIINTAGFDLPPVVTLMRPRTTCNVDLESRTDEQMG